MQTSILMRANAEGNIKCYNCKEFKPEAQFKSPDGKVMPSCWKCRAKYMEAQQRKKGLKRCRTCKQILPLEEYQKDDNEFVNCKNCRNKWFAEQLEKEQQDTESEAIHRITVD